MNFLAKFDRNLISKKSRRLNGCTISLTFENVVCRIYPRRLRWLHEKPQKRKVAEVVSCSVFGPFWDPYRGSC